MSANSPITQIMRLWLFAMGFGDDSFAADPWSVHTARQAISSRLLVTARLHELSHATLKELSTGSERAQAENPNTANRVRHTRGKSSLLIIRITDRDNVAGTES